MKRITDNRKLSQTIKPNFTDKTLKDERTTLADGDKVITEEKDVVKKIQGSLWENSSRLLKLTVLSDLSDDPVLNATGNFSHHDSVLKIKEARDSSDCFSFKLITIVCTCKEILALHA